ncbi:ABC transporter transmembrane domain-containing protein [Acuticoccus yangtzensis]|uniref:ABC transporter transmembrane domain-containing protein n=1 Tax=Acuticoccus yangtzensis TaxID=1443441 RepID=UPI0009496440|nr:ABC transporter transmembrane domain-containing protein [Acuticoccus yangtzensis]
MGELVALTMALNVLGLCVPIVASQVFGRVLPNPGSATLSVLALILVACGVAEALLRYARAAIMARAGANFAGATTHRVLTMVLLGEPPRGGTTPAQSLDYLAAISQLKDRYNGQILVSIVELLFLPMMIAVILTISVTAGVMVSTALVIFAAVTLREALQMKGAAHAAKAMSEARYGTLFSLLSAIQAIKALGIEDTMLRRYETVQGAVTAANHKLALASGRLITSGPIASQVLVALVLAFGALSVANGSMTMGGVTAIVIIASRLMAPVQRAVFVYVQMRDVEAARVAVQSVLDRPLIANPVEGRSAPNEGRAQVDDVTVSHNGVVMFEGANLTISPGEVIALSGADPKANAALMHVIAGIIAPTRGSVRLNGLAPTEVPQSDLNRFVGYVPPHGSMFRGTIRDNITRFGEVTSDAAMEVAEILEIDDILKTLPNGLDTELMGGANETIAPGLVQQLALVRALATRPRLILFNNADRGLDQEGYAKLHRFVGKIHGQASFVILSDDVNLLGYANRRFTLTRSGLVRTEGFEMRERTAYRDVKL